MAKLRDPPITCQFLEACFLQESTLPVLVMERLDSSLNELQEGAPGLPVVLKQLLEDVARGLLYLHACNPPVVDCDLMAKNILLEDLMAGK